MKTIELKFEIRKKVALRGQTLTEYAESNGVLRQSIGNILGGRWKGPKATSIMRKVCLDLGIDYDIYCSPPSLPDKNRTSKRA